MSSSGALADSNTSGSSWFEAGLSIVPLSGSAAVAAMTSTALSSGGSEGACSAVVGAPVSPACGMSASSASPVAVSAAIGPSTSADDKSFVSSSATSAASDASRTGALSISVQAVRILIGQRLIVTLTLVNLIRSCCLINMFCLYLVIPIGLRIWLVHFLVICNDAASGVGADASLSAVVFFVPISSSTTASFNSSFATATSSLIPSRLKQVQQQLLQMRRAVSHRLSQSVPVVFARSDSLVSDAEPSLGASSVLSSTVAGSAGASGVSISTASLVELPIASLSSTAASDKSFACFDSSVAGEEGSTALPSCAGKASASGASLIVSAADDSSSFSASDVLAFSDSESSDGGLDSGSAASVASSGGRGSFAVSAGSSASFVSSPSSGPGSITSSSGGGDEFAQPPQIPSYLHRDQKIDRQWGELARPSRADQAQQQRQFPQSLRPLEPPARLAAMQCRHQQHDHLRPSGQMYLREPAAQPRQPLRRQPQGLAL
ncbi:hypothetical protein KCU65_g395, partial [Aureobasidium melanogenum]